MVPRDCTVKFNGIKGKITHVANNNPNYNPNAPKAVPTPPRAARAAVPTLPLLLPWTPLLGPPTLWISHSQASTSIWTSISWSPFTLFPLYWPPLFGPPVLQDVHLLVLPHQLGLPRCDSLNRFVPTTPFWHPHSLGHYTQLTFHTSVDSHSFGASSLLQPPTHFHPPTISLF